MCRRAVTLGILCGLLWAAGIVPASALPAPSWTVTQVTTATAPNEYVAVGGDRLAWLDTTSSMRKLYTWKAGDVSPTLVREGSIYMAPRISGGRCAWTEYGGLGNYFVYVWTPVGSTVTTVVASTRQIQELQFSGDRLAWRTDDGAQQEVKTCLSDGSQLLTLNIGLHSAFGPQISGDRVVWYESDGTHMQIATWVPGGVSTWVTSDARQHWDPAFSDGRIAWIAETGFASEEAIYTQLVTESVPTTVQVVPNYFPDPPLASGDRVVWLQAPVGPANDLVYSWSAADPEPRVVAPGTGDQSFEGLSGDRIVWIDGSTPGEQRVMTWAEGDTTASVLASGTDAAETCVSGDRIVWRRNIGTGSYQIMTAVLETPAVLPVRTTLRSPTVSPTKPTHNKHAHFYAVLTPGSARTAAGATTTLKLYRKETHYVTKKVNGKNRRVKVAYWHLRHSVLMKRYSSTSTTVKMTATVTPKYSGSWKVVVRYSGGTGFLGSTSPTKYFTVK